MAKLAIGDNLIQLLGLIDQNSGTYQNAATVTGALYDLNYNLIAGTSFTLTYVTSSNGNYSADVQFLLPTIQRGVQYKVLVVATVGAVQDTWEGDFIASYL